MNSLSEESQLKRMGMGSVMSYMKREHLKRSVTRTAKQQQKISEKRQADRCYFVNRNN